VTSLSRSRYGISSTLNLEYFRNKPYSIGGRAAPVWRVDMAR
jgi:hypothetical protein